MITSKLQSITHYQEIKETVLNSVGLRQSFINIAGSVIASGLAALALMLVSRFLGPEYFGQFSTAFALTLILMRLNDLGLSTATSKLVPAAANPAQKKGLLSLIFRFRLALSGLIIVAGVICSQFLPNYLLTANPALILLAFLLTAPMAFFEHTQFSLQALQKFKLSALLNSGQGFLKLLFVMPLILVILDKGVSSFLVLLIFVVYVSAPALITLLAAAIKPKAMPLHIELPTDINLKQLRLQIWNIARHAGLGLLAAGIIENIDIIFVQAVLSDYQAGLLGGVTRIALLLYTVGYALGNVLNPRAARYTNWENMRRFWQKAWLIVGLCVIGFVFTVLLTEPLIFYTIGPEYLAAADVLRILLAAGFVTVAVMPFIAMFYAFDKPWYFSVSGLVQLIIVLAGNLLFVPVYGLPAAAWTRLTARIVLLIMTAFLAGRAFANMKPTPVEAAAASANTELEPEQKQD